MKSFTVDVDPLAGIVERVHLDDDRIIRETIQDSTAIVEANHALYTHFDERSNWKGDGEHRVASIPLSIFFKLKADGIVDDPVRFKRWLNDSENQAFRTRPGRV